MEVYNYYRIFNIIFIAVAVCTMIVLIMVTAKKSKPSAKLLMIDMAVVCLLFLLCSYKVSVLKYHPIDEQPSVYELMNHMQKNPCITQILEYNDVNPDDYNLTDRFHVVTRKSDLLSALKGYLKSDQLYMYDVQIVSDAADKIDTLTDNFVVVKNNSDDKLTELDLFGKFYIVSTNNYNEIKNTTWCSLYYDKDLKADKDNAYAGYIVTGEKV
jgi:hypothetical protein